MAVGVAANSVTCLRELKKSLAPMSRHIRVLAGEDRRGREEGGGELQGVEHRKGVFELVGITVVEGQQRGGAGGQGGAVQPCWEMRQGKDKKTAPRGDGQPGGKT